MSVREDIDKKIAEFFPDFIGDAPLWNVGIACEVCGAMIAPKRRYVDLHKQWHESQES